MAENVVNKNDELVLKLLHYFITEQGYNPIVLHGAKDEIWLENLNSEYKIVRIVTNYIHNNEQVSFDLYRANEIIKRIKQKTLTIKANALTIFINLGESVTLNNVNEYSNIKIASVKKISDIKKYHFITEAFPSISAISKIKEKGMQLFMKLTDEINSKNEKDAKSNNSIFSPKKPIITSILIAINFIMFIILLIFNKDSSLLINANTLYEFGGSVADQIRIGEIYRLLTSGFLHASLMHLVFNMYALYVIGPQIESFFGKKKFIMIYLYSLIVSDLLSTLFLGSNVVGVGASGAIFGLLGSILYFGYHYRVYLGTVLKSQIIPLIIFNLSLGFMIPGVDMTAHIGGLIAGILISMAVGIKDKTPSEDKINGIILSTIFAIFLVILHFYI